MEKKLTKNDLFWMFMRSNIMQASWNMERMQGMGFCYTLIPALRRLYSGEDLAKALRRHMEFYNTHPFVHGAVLGITAAMEEKKANGADVADGVINGIKVGMMGPLAGVGDPIFWGTLRPITAALGASFAISGSIIGPLLFFILFNLIRMAALYYGVQYGYTKGTDVVQDVAGNKLQKITEGASILGLFVMGALVNKWTSVHIPVVISEMTNDKGQVVVTTVQSVLDQLMPGLIPLLMTFACMSLLKRKVNAIWIIFGLFAIGIICYALGIMSLQ